MAVKSGWLASGPQVHHLESDFQHLDQSAGSIAVSSGTAAIFLALKALGLGRGARVGIPSYSCTALLNAVSMAGATAVLIDNAPGDFNMSLTENLDGLHGVIVVHTYGKILDTSELRSRVPVVIEDRCHSLGSSHRPLGTDGGSDAAVYSFYSTKIITGGYGGLVSFRSQTAADLARDYRNFDNRQDGQARFNFLLSDLNAALVRSQFQRLSRIREKRLEIALRYSDVIPAELLQSLGDLSASRMVYRFVLNMSQPSDATRLIHFLRDRGIVAIRPMERGELLHQQFDSEMTRCPNAEQIAEQGVSLPIFPALQKRELIRVLRELRNFFKA